MKSKMLSLFLVLCLILSCFPVSVMAAQSQSNEDLVSVIGLSYDGLEYGYHDCSAIVKNNTDTTISSLSVAFVFMNDEHTIVSVSYGAGDTRIRPGQSITLTASVPEDTPATSFNVDCCMFVDETGQNSICYFNSVPKNEPLGSESRSSYSATDMVNNSLDTDEPVSVVSLGYYKLEFGFHEFYCELRNNTDSPIHALSATMVLLNDNGTILDTQYPQEQVRLQPGQSIYLFASEEENTDATYFNVDSYMYVDADEQFHENYFNVIPEDAPMKGDSNAHPGVGGQSLEFDELYIPDEHDDYDALTSDEPSVILSETQKVDAIVYLIQLTDQYGDYISDDEFDISLSEVANRYGVTSDEIFLLYGDANILQKAYTKLANQGQESVVSSYDAVLEYGDGKVLVFSSEDALSRYITALTKSRQGTMDEMFLSGEVSYTAKGTKCNIISTGISRAKVKLLDGPLAGNVVWVIIESVHEK